jgi:hypothetical protein
MPGHLQNSSGYLIAMNSSHVFIFLAIFFGYINSSAICVPIEKPADKVLIEKRARRLSLLRNNTVFKTYSISLGNQATGPKTCQGDGRTPEGLYIIDGRNPKRISRTKALFLRCHPIR